MLNRSPVICSVCGKKANFQPASINYVTGADTLSDTASSQSYSQPINSGEPKAPPRHYSPFFITVIVPYKLIKMKHAVGSKKSSYQTTGDEEKVFLFSPSSSFTQVLPGNQVNIQTVSVTVQFWSNMVWNPPTSDMLRASVVWLKPWVLACMWMLFDP